MLLKGMRDLYDLRIFGTHQLQSSEVRTHAILKRGPFFHLLCNPMIV